MIDHVARQRRLANLGAIALLVLAVGACTSAGGASTTVTGGPGSTVQHRLEGDPYAAGTRPDSAAGTKSSAPTSTFVGYGAGMPTAQPTQPGIRDGRSGIHPGGGGPQQ